MKGLIITLALCISGCARNAPNVDPTTARMATANEVVVALGSLQHAAIELNKVGVLSEANTRIVVENVTSTLKAMGPNPTNIQVTVSNTLTEIERRLDAAGRTDLADYIRLVRTIAGLLPVIRGGNNGGTTSDLVRGNATRLAGHLNLAATNWTYRPAHVGRTPTGVQCQSAEIHRGRRNVASRPSGGRELKEVA